MCPGQVNRCTEGVISSMCDEPERESEIRTVHLKVLPVDRRKPGSKHHVLTDGNGVPIVAKTTAANRHDVTELLNLVNYAPGIKGKPGAPRYRFDELCADGLIEFNYDLKCTREPAMSLGLNDCRSRLRVSSSLDPSSEIDRIGSYQAKRERFSLGFRGGALHWCPNDPATEPGNRYMGNMSQTEFFLWGRATHRYHGGGRPVTVRSSEGDTNARVSSEKEGKTYLAGSLGC